MKRYLLIFLTTILALSACTTKDDGATASLAGSWKLTSYGPANAQIPSVTGAEAGLTFNKDGTITGNFGCNGFGGNYAAKGDQVTFREIVSTLMACDDPRMAQERAVQRVLTDTATFKIEGNTLTLTKGDMDLVLTR